MSSKGQRGNCIYNWQWELNSKYKGWLTSFKAGRQRPCVNAAIEWSTFQTWESLHWNRTWKVKARKTTVELGVNRLWHYPHLVLYHVELEFSWSTKSGNITITTKSVLTIPPPPQDNATPRSQSSLEGHVTKDNVLKAETLWTLKLVTSHYSFNSSKDTSQLFSAMFPDGQIASQFPCGERTLQKAAPRQQCQWTFCCVIWWKPKHKNAAKANGCPC